MDTDNQRITGYLVGDLPETEQEELERLYFSDPAVIERVTEVESRLLDAYARGQLSDDMRERVARRYLTHPVRRERLKFAEALAARLEDFEPADARGEKRQQSGWAEAWGWWAGPGRTVRFSMTVAVLMLTVTAGWLFVERIRLQESLHRVQEADATQYNANVNWNSSSRPSDGMPRPSPQNAIVSAPSNPIHPMPQHRHDRHPPSSRWSSRSEVSGPLMTSRARSKCRPAPIRSDSN